MDENLILDQYLLHEDEILSKLIENIRKEISDAILSAKIKHSYNKDVTLSFGTIHINPYGSVSQFSFNGLDVSDVDKFVVTKALNVSADNFYDIRNNIENDSSLFDFYPILYKNRIYYTVLKSSKYFHNLFGTVLSNHDRVMVKYALKYLIVTIEGNTNSVNYVFLCGLFNPESQSRKIITDAGRNVGPHSNLYYCFAPNTNYLLKTGQVKPDFIGFAPRSGKELFDFYSGSVESAVFWISRVRDSNSKIKMKESKKKAYKALIEIQYGSVSKFCNIHSINEQFLISFLSGIENKPIYKNGDLLTMTRLSELLKIEINDSEDGLKDKNLMRKVSFYDIPDDWDVDLC